MSVYIACTVSMLHIAADWALLFLHAVLLTITLWAGFRIRVAAIKGWLVTLLAIAAAAYFPAMLIVGWLSRTNLLSSRVKAK